MKINIIVNNNHIDDIKIFKTFEDGLEYLNFLKQKWAKQGFLSDISSLNDEKVQMLITNINFELMTTYYLITKEVEEYENI